MNSKKHQVFISSTYTDLIPERQRVFQTLMEMDCIPSGMELFPAADDEQMTFIRRLIDECDYYLLIVGGRYGSVAETGLSYTEMEYQYAVEKGKYIVALLHKSPDEIPAKHIEKTDQGRARLDLFRKRVETGRIVKYYSGIEDLAGKVALSLNHAIRNHPMPGWIKGDQIVDARVLVEMEVLRKENEALKKRQPQKPNVNVSNIAPATTVFTIRGWGRNASDSKHSWKESKTFNEWLSFIGPVLLCPQMEGEIKSYIANTLHNAIHCGVEDQSFQDLKIQMYAYDWIKFSIIGDEAKQTIKWTLSESAMGLLIELRTQKQGNG